MGDTATQLLSQSIKAYGRYRKLNLTVFDADYNQIDAQVMDENSEFYSFKPDCVLIDMAAEKAYEFFCSCGVEERSNFAVDYFNKIRHYWDIISSHRKCSILQFTFAEYNDGVFGNYGGKTAASFLYQIRKLNLLLMDGAQEYKNVFLVDYNALQSHYGRQFLYDEKYYYSARMPVTVDALPLVAEQVIHIIESLTGRIKKCIVLDLDNTLWGGVIGDDGLTNIQIGELGTGRAFTDFQRWLKMIRERGILLAVCSKNNEDTAKEPFEKHPDMVLRLDDISMFVANWDDKVSNIKYIQKVLNIGMDSMVFLDDNPFEREMVKKMIPEISVPDLPEDPAKYISYLQRLDLFETASYSEEDLNRTKQYQAEVGRTNLQKSFESIDDYLISLQMAAEAKPFDSFHYPRIAQLSQRSNQFNLRTVRYTEAEIADIAQCDKYITIYFTLSDQFGDHGLISVVILEKKMDGILFVDTWFMSCRVLKRGMEEFIVNTIIERAKENGFKKVVGEYIKTPKNAMVEHIYSRLGFTQTDDYHYSANVETFQKQRTYIKEKQA